MALDVASRGDSHMHAGEIMMCVLGITGVVLNLLADAIRQLIGLLVGGSAGRGATTAFCGGRLALKYGQFHKKAPKVGVEGF